MKSIKFLHMADAHLGYSQYHSDIRYKDFNRAFMWILNKAIDEEVDFILMAGDLFNKKDTNPTIFYDIYKMLDDFKKKSQDILGRDIPFVVIEGNHDKPIGASDSWLRVLARLNQIYLLSSKYDRDEKKVIFEPYNTQISEGGFIEIGDTRIYGMQYYGSLTADLLGPLYEALESNNEFYTILMMHYGIAGEDPSLKGMKFNDDVQKLHEKVDYLAFGHFHSMYSYPKDDPWLFNPGSIENIGQTRFFNTTGQINRDRGIYIVTFNGKDRIPNAVPIKVSKGTPEDKNNEIPNRLLQKLRVKLTGLEVNNWSETEDYIVEKLRGTLPTKSDDFEVDPDSLDHRVLALTIQGSVPYPSSDIRLRELKKRLLEEFELLEVRLYTKRLYSSLDQVSGDTSKNLTRREIEQQVFSDLIKKTDEYSEKSDAIVNILQDIKSHFLDNERANYSELEEHISDWFEINLSDMVDIQDPEKDKEFQNFGKWVNLLRTGKHDKYGPIVAEINDYLEKSKASTEATPWGDVEAEIVEEKEDESEIEIPTGYDEESETAEEVLDDLNPDEFE